MCQCWVCQSEYKKIKKTVFKEMYLDDIPKYDDTVYFDEQFEMCQNCKMVGEDLQVPMTEKNIFEMMKIIESEQYQQIVNDKNLGKIEKKMLLKKWLIDNHIVGGFGVNFLLFSYYDLNNDSEKAKRFAIEEIHYLEERTNEKKKYYEDDNEMYLTCTLYENFKLTELYRRLGMFDKAVNICEQYKNYKYSEIEKILKEKMKKEQKLCKKRISARV